jgi:hypothetical protein
MTDMQVQGGEHSMIKTPVCDEVIAFSAFQAATEALFNVVISETTVD